MNARHTTIGISRETLALLHQLRAVWDQSHALGRRVLRYDDRGRVGLDQIVATLARAELDHLERARTQRARSKRRLNGASKMGGAET